MLQPVCWILLVAVLGLIVIGVVMYVKGDQGKPIQADDPMPPRRVVVLITYLLAFGVGLVFMLVSLTALDFPETSVAPLESPPAIATASPASANNANTSVPAAKPTPPPTATPLPTPIVPILIRVFPQVTVGSTPNERLAIYGKNFNSGSKIRFDTEELPTEYFSENLIRVRLEPSNLVGRGSITVDVKNPDGALSNAIPVPIEKPQVKLNLFFLAHPPVTREMQLLLLVIFAGALGSYLHAIMSLADYVAKKELTASWFWWYLSRPFLGMAMALVFYAVLRGGFLAGTPADAKVVNPFGVLTIGALVGMFSYKAAQKLGEIFDVVFKATAPPEASVAPIITKLEPDNVPKGSAEPVSIKINGEHLSKITTVLLGSKKIKPDIVSEQATSFTLPVEEMAQARQIEVVAVTSLGAVSEAEILTVSEDAGGGESDDDGRSKVDSSSSASNGDAAGDEQSNGAAGDEQSNGEAAGDEQLNGKAVG